MERMRHLYSLIACIIICTVVVNHRMAHIGPVPGKPLRVTDWDNLGYYMYLPGIFIYNDIEKLDWVSAIDARYSMVGNNGFYQAEKAANGNYIDKYLGGVAIMQAPFFFAAHWYAKKNGYMADGFSAPYQYAIAFAAIFYALLGVFLLRRFLRYYFNDTVVTITLLLLCLATNFLQYVAIDGGMSHAYIFLLYVWILYAVKCWHDKPSLFWAAATGYIIGWATICRPTEAVMLFIPLMWNTHNKEAAIAKWTKVKSHKFHVFIAVLSGFAGIIPQLIYWKYVSGNWIYDVGSAWDFLTPHFRVLWGWEKGWFIYTPITVFFIIGMLFIKNYEWRKSVLWFCLFNIYIIISWRDWHYGASYSTRALMQSYPLFALPFAAFVARLNQTKWKWFFYALGIYLIIVNLFQHEQYSKTILHYDEMNRKYYGRIYLNPHPTPLDMSMLDNDEMLNNEKRYKQTVLFRSSKEMPVSTETDSNAVVSTVPISANGYDTWLKVTADIKTYNGIWGAYLCARLQKQDKVKHVKVRLLNPIASIQGSNAYMFYIHVPKVYNSGELQLYVSKHGNYEGMIENLRIITLSK